MFHTISRFFLFFVLFLRFSGLLSLFMTWVPPSKIPNMTKIKISSFIPFLRFLAILSLEMLFVIAIWFLVNNVIIEIPLKYITKHTWSMLRISIHKSRNVSYIVMLNNNFILYECTLSSTQQYPMDNWKWNYFPPVLDWQLGQVPRMHWCLLVLVPYPFHHIDQI